MSSATEAPEVADYLEDPHYLGPTWKRDAEGNFLIPRKSLGYGVILWLTTHLTSLQDPNKALRITDEQARFILWWYAVDDEGEFLYKTGTLQRLKGWGKDPLAAMLAIVEANGPVEFSHFTKEGNAVGKTRHQSTVVVVAVSEDQTRNLSMNFLPLIPQRTKELFGIGNGLQLIRSRSGLAEIKMCSSNYKSLQGKPSNFVICDETHHWDASNSGHMLYETVKFNAQKVQGRLLCITNAFRPGEDSVAERNRDAWEASNAGRVEKIKMMYDSIEAPPDVPMTRQALTHMIDKCRGSSWWFPLEDAVDSMLDVSADLASLRRFWLNQVVSTSDALYSPEQISSFFSDVDEDMPQPGDEVVLGFDGSKSDDSTALVALRVSDRKAFLIAVWENQRNSRDWQVDTKEVQQQVDFCFENFRVRGFYSDVMGWESTVTEWSQRYGKQLAVRGQGQACAWDMRGVKRTTQAHELLLDSLLEGRTQIAPSNTMLKHLRSVMRKDNVHGIYFDKRSNHAKSAKVDCYAALLLAHKALCDYELVDKPDDEAGGFYRT